MLRVVEMSVLRIITGNTLRDRRHNESIREGLGQEVDVVQIVQQRRLTYYGHITWMDIGGCQISYYAENYMAHDRVADRARGGLTTYRRTAERWECR